MNIRDIIWNYPDYFNRVLRFLAPISYLLILIPIFSLIIFFFTLYLKDITVIDTQNTIKEGTVGYVSSINLLLNPVTQADRDIRKLTNVNFINIDSKGELSSSSLVKSWKASNDFKKYTVTLREDIYWHDGENVDIEDVNTTVVKSYEMYRNGYSDSIGSYFEGVTFSIDSKYEGSFVLNRRDPLFLQNLNIYIIPSHIFKDYNVQSLVDYNYTWRFVGNGPYILKKVENNTYYFDKNSKYLLGTPKIDNYEYHLFPTIAELEIAYRNGGINTISNVSTNDISFISEYKNTKKIDIDVKNRQRILFINSRVERLSNIELRNTLSYLLDREMILNISKIDGKVDVSFISSDSWAYDKDIDHINYNKEKGEKILETLGYVKDGVFYVNKEGKILSLTLSFIENERNLSIANAIKSAYEQVGILIELKGFTFEQMNKEILATRSYELIMYEVEKTMDPDQYDLWHSSRIDYPNLNLSGYKNDRADLFLERGRSDASLSARKESYSLLQRLFALETPAIGLFRQSFIFVIPSTLDIKDTSSIYYPEDRYINIHNWSFNN